VGLDAGRAAVAASAAKAALPGGAFASHASLDEAIAAGHPVGPAVLVLSDPADSAVARAAQALDPSGLPRWAVVIIRAGSPDPDVEAVAPEDWSEPLVARVLRLSAASNRQRREIAALRGDLLTFGLRIAHDLRTPLGGISVSAEALKDAIREASPGNVALVKPILDSSDELAHLIRRVSTLAKATARPVPRERFAMGTAVWAALERLRPEIARVHGKVTEPESWPDVTGDAVSVEAVWWNLVSNALTHSGEKPRIELGWMEEPGVQRFWVSDNGPGIPTPRRGSLFHPFHRMHEANAVRGLGLAIVHRLVHLLGGTCGYEDQPSGGSRFYFTLPSAPKPSRA
jgi:signal transduction histidine kinase